MPERGTNAETPRGRGERCGAGGQLGFAWDPRHCGVGPAQMALLLPLFGSFWLLAVLFLCRNGLHSPHYHQGLCYCVAWQRFSFSLRDRKHAWPMLTVEC
jgi:hypothetical protein